MEELYKDIQSRYGDDIITLKIAVSEEAYDDVIYIDNLPALERLMNSL